MRWLPIALMLSTFAANAASAETHQLIANLDVYECVESNCTPGERCSLSGPGTCTELQPGAPLCVDDMHAQEPYCCYSQVDCPVGTTCLRLSDQAFGVCVGRGIPRFCSKSPTTRHLERCRDHGDRGDYDWSHGDCDGDGVVNDDDDTLCASDPRCYCDADVDGRAGDPYVIDLSDATLISMCVRDSRPAACDRADINCDGAVDYCDVAAARLAIDVGADGPEHYICTAIECGNCLTEEGCVRSGRSYCVDSDFLNGTYFGDAECDVPILTDGGAGDGGPSDGAVRDSGVRDSAARDGGGGETGGFDGASSGVSFRGAGGCACHVASGDPAIPAPLLAIGIGALIALRRRARR